MTSTVFYEVLRRIHDKLTSHVIHILNPHYIRNKIFVPFYAFNFKYVKRKVLEFIIPNDFIENDMSESCLKLKNVYK